MLGKLRKYHHKEEQLLVFSKDFIGEEVFAYGVYEKHEIELIAKVINHEASQSTALDIGANIGNHAIQFSKIFKEVICFEPNPLIFEILKLNTRSATHVHCYNIGLSNEEKTAFLEIPEKNFGGAKIAHSKSQKTLDILLKKGDDIIEKAFSFIKIDVEGHEMEALLGMEKSILTNKPIICFELINKDASSLKIIEFLKNLGYRKFYIPYQKSIFPKSGKKRFYRSFIDGLIFKKTSHLQAEESFNKPFYNLIFCEREDSNFRIKKEAIKK